MDAGKVPDRDAGFSLSGMRRSIYTGFPASKSRRPRLPRIDATAALASHLYAASDRQGGAKRLHAVAEGSCTVGATILSMPREAKHRRRGRLAVATSEETE
jgi:hypothetical protein